MNISGEDLKRKSSNDAPSKPSGSAVVAVAAAATVSATAAAVLLLALMQAMMSLSEWRRAASSAAWVRRTAFSASTAWRPRAVNFLDRAEILAYVIAHRICLGCQERDHRLCDPKVASLGEPNEPQEGIPLGT